MIQDQDPGEVQISTTKAALFEAMRITTVFTMCSVALDMLQDEEFGIDCSAFKNDFETLMTKVTNEASKSIGA